LAGGKLQFLERYYRQERRNEGNDERKEEVPDKDGLDARGVESIAQRIHE
jgi:hypothetical protein